MSKQKLHISPGDIQKAKQFWEVKKSISHVAYETGLKRAQIKQLIEDGILHLPTSTRRNNPTTSVDKKTKASHDTIRAKADAHIAEMKARLESLDSIDSMDTLVSTIGNVSNDFNIVGKDVASLANPKQKEQDEDLISQSAMRTALNLSRIIEYTTDTLVRAVEEGEIKLPDKLDIKSLTALTSSIDKMTSAVERAIKIERGKPKADDDNNQAKLIATLITTMSAEDLEFVIKNGGALPQHVMQTLNATIVDSKTV